MAQQVDSRVDRRTFLSATTAGSLVMMGAALAPSAEKDATISLGLIGCGGRGNWIANLFAAHGGYRFTACADYFPQRVEQTGGRLGIDAGKRFTGLSGYKRLLDEPLDAVVIETPPYFHPEQAAAAVEAGKHVFLAKPIAVDVPGCQGVGQSGAKAREKKLVFLVDFQTRADPLYREAVGHVHQGAIGKLIAGEAHYPWAGLPHAPAQQPEARLQNWYAWREISGDCIIEQDIHALDVATWIIGADPIKAIGTGGAALRPPGTIWDHFSILYTFPNNFVLNFSSIKGIPGMPDSIDCRVCGDQGVIDTNYFGEVAIRGRNPLPGGPMTDLYSRGTQLNISEFHDAITKGDYANATVAPSVRSNLTCVLGRTAAYQGREVTWEEMLRQGERYQPDLSGLKDS